MNSSIRIMKIFALAVAVLMATVSMCLAADLEAIGEHAEASEAIVYEPTIGDVQFTVPQGLTVISVTGNNEPVPSYGWEYAEGILTIKGVYAGSRASEAVRRIGITATCTDSAQRTQLASGSILIRSKDREFLAVKTPMLKTNNPSIDLGLTSKTPTVMKIDELVQLTGLSQSSFVTGNTEVNIGQGYDDGYGLSRETMRSIFGQGTYSSLQCVKGTVVRSGDILPIAYKVMGADLVDIGNGPVKASELKIWKVLSRTEKHRLTFASTETDFVDGSFAIFTTSEAQRSGAVSLSARDDISIGSAYVLVVFIKDGGIYDLAKDEDFVVADPIVVEDTIHVTQPVDNGGSGGGCSVAGVSLAMLAAVGAALRKRR